jgi:hypothetical protein
MSVESLQRHRALRPVPCTRIIYLQPDTSNINEVNSENNVPLLVSKRRILDIIKITIIMTILTIGQLGGFHADNSGLHSNYKS